MKLNRMWQARVSATSSGTRRLYHIGCLTICQLPEADRDNRGDRARCTEWTARASGLGAPYLDRKDEGRTPSPRSSTSLGHGVLGNVTLRRSDVIVTADAVRLRRLASVGGGGL